jgi:hypothetical protein
MAQLIATIFEISSTNWNYTCSTASESRHNTDRKIQDSLVVGTTFKIRRYEPLQVTSIYTGISYMEERKTFNEMFR